MFKPTITFNDKNLVYPSIIFVLLIILVYSPVIFLSQSYLQITPISPQLLEYSGKSTLFGITVDYSGFPGNWPEIKLASQLFLEGKIPLWDPYIGVGQPLAAESTHHVFSPINLGFLLPVQFWDIALLATLWIAGIFTFLFLRTLGLNFGAALAGGIFYMFSGGFTWYLANPNILVMAFTPFILYSLEKIILHRNPKYIALASVAFAFAILGAHLESLVLQFLLVGLYLGYRTLYPAISNYYQKRRERMRDTNSLIPHSAKRILSWSVLAFIGGIGLSAFFVLPVYEFVENNHLERGTDTGIGHANSIGISSGFLPYILGTLHAYWGHFQAGFNLWSYVGIFALYFSILGIWLSSKNHDNRVHRYTPLFFLAVSVFILLKTIGIPLINWIGYAPLLNLITFPQYAGVIMPFGFAIAAAFGIDLLGKLRIKTKNLGIICIISISIILLLLIPLLPYLSSNAEFAPSVTVNDARNYVGFQVIQAVLFSIFAFLSSVAIMRNKSAILGLVCLILLELSIYIPEGLHPIWMAYKSILVLIGMGTITFLILKQNRFTLHFGEPNKIKFYIIAVVMVATFSGEVLISGFSPFGMMERHDSFQQNNVTNFFKDKLGNSRMFSFDSSMEPNYPAAYKLSTIGQLSPFNIDSFYNFIHNFLDNQTEGARLGSTPWTYSYGPMESINKFFENKKYFDFLGVKYVLTEGYDFNTFAPAIPGISSQYAKISSFDNSTGQSFISPTSSISAIGISLGTSELQNQGNLILTMDSIPRDQKYHRQSSINQTINQQFNEFRINPPLDDVLNKKFYLSLKYPKADNNELAVVFIVKENQTGFDLITNKLHGKFYENGIPVSGKQMVFSIVSNSNKYPIAFKFRDIRIYENTDAFPRSFLVTNFHVVDTRKAQDFLLKNPNFDLRHEVILEEQLPKQMADQLISSIISDNSVEIGSYSENKVTVHTNNKGASLLVLTDVYYPGWKVYVDGSESHMYRADGLVRAVFVPAGNHTIEFSYMPKSFVIGLSVSLITAGFLFTLFVYSKRKRMIKGTT